MSTRAVSFTVIATNREESSEGKGDPRSSFWRPFRERYKQAFSNPREYTDSDFENHFERTFGLNLKRGLINYLADSWLENSQQRSDDTNTTKGFENERKALAGVFFRARIK